MAERRPFPSWKMRMATTPILSVVNIIDIFLVSIAALLIAVMENPLNPFTLQDAVIIKDPGKPSM